MIFHWNWINASATTLASVKNTWVFRTALTALTEPRTFWRRSTCYTSPRRRVTLHMYLLYFVVTFTHHQKDTCVTLFAGAAVLLKQFTQCLEMLNHSYYLSFNNFQNLCIQFVFSSMYLCIYIATYLHMVYLDWQHAVVVSNSRCAWRWRSSELRETLRGRDRASLEMQLVTEIEWTQRCTERPWLSEFGDALGGCDRVSVEMHFEAMIERGWRCNWRPRLSELRDALRAVIERV